MSDEQDDFSAAVAESLRVMESYNRGEGHWKDLIQTFSGPTRQGPDTSDSQHANTSDYLGARNRRIIALDANGQMADRFLVNDAQLGQLLSTQERTGNRYIEVPSVGPDDGTLTDEQRALVSIWDEAERKDYAEAARANAYMGVGTGLALDVLSAVPFAGPAAIQMFGDEVVIDGVRTGVNDLAAGYAYHERERETLSDLTYLGTNVLAGVLTLGTGTAAKVGLAATEEVAKRGMLATAGHAMRGIISSRTAADLRKYAPMLVGGGMDVAMDRGLKVALGKMGTLSERGAALTAGAGAGAFGAMRDYMTDVMMDEQRELSVEGFVGNGMIGGVFGVAGESAASWISKKNTMRNARKLAESNNSVMGALYQTLKLDEQKGSLVDFLQNPDNVPIAYEAMNKLMRTTDEDVAKLSWGTKLLNTLRWVGSGGAVSRQTLARMSTPKFRAGLEYAHKYLGKGDSEIFQAMTRATLLLSDGAENIRRLDEFATGSRALNPDVQQGMSEVTAGGMGPGTEAPLVPGGMSPEQRTDALLKPGGDIEMSISPAGNQIPDNNPSNLRGLMTSLAQDLSAQVSPGGPYEMSPRKVAELTRKLFGIELGVRRVKVGVEQVGDRAATKTEWAWLRSVDGKIPPLRSTITAISEDQEAAARGLGDIVSIELDLERHLGEIDEGAVQISPEGVTPPTKEQFLADLDLESADLLKALGNVAEQFEQGAVLVPGTTTRTATPPGRVVKGDFQQKIERGQALLEAMEEFRVTNKGAPKKVLSQLRKLAGAGNEQASANKFIKAWNEAGKPPQGRMAFEAYAKVVAAKENLDRLVKPTDGELIHKSGNKRGQLMTAPQDQDKWMAAVKQLNEAEAALLTHLDTQGSFPSLPVPEPPAKSAKTPAWFKAVAAAVESGDAKKIIDAFEKEEVLDFLTKGVKAADRESEEIIDSYVADLAAALGRYAEHAGKVDGEAFPAAFIKKMNFAEADSTLMGGYQMLRQLAREGGDTFTAGRQFNVLQNMKKGLNKQTKKEDTLAQFYGPGVTALKRLLALTESPQLWGADWALGQQMINRGYNGLIADAAELKQFFEPGMSGAYADAGVAPIEAMKAHLYGKTNAVPNQNFPRALTKMISNLSMMLGGGKLQGIDRRVMLRELAGNIDGGTLKRLRRRGAPGEDAERGFEGIDITPEELGQKALDDFDLLLANAVQLQNALQSSAELAQAFGDQWRNAGLMRNGAPGWIRMPSVVAGTNPEGILNRGVRYMDGVVQQYVIRPVSSENFLTSMRASVLSEQGTTVQRMGKFRQYLRDVTGGGSIKQRASATILKSSLPIMWAKLWVGSDEEVDEMYATLDARMRQAYDGTEGTPSQVADGLPTQSLQTFAEQMGGPFLSTQYADAGNLAVQKFVSIQMDLADRQPRMPLEGVPASQQPPPHPSQKRAWLKLVAAASEGPSIVLPLMEAGMLDPELAQFVGQHFPRKTGQIVAAFAEEIQSGKFPWDVLLQFENLTGSPLTPNSTPAAILASQQANQGANTPAAAAATGLQRRGQVRMAGLAATDNELRQRRHERQGRA